MPTASTYPSEKPDVWEASVHEADAYRRLLRTLQATKGTFALILVEDELEEAGTSYWLERLWANLREQGVTPMTAQVGHDLDPVLVLERLSHEAASPRVVVLRGLEKTPLGPENRERPPAFASLNVYRETVERMFHDPLIVWCDPLSYRALHRHAPDFFDHFTGLIKFPASDSSQPSERSYRSMAPRPDGFVERHQLDEIAEILSAADADVVGVTTALRGAGGFGKTTIAQAICHDQRIRSKFPDGVLWTSMVYGLTEGDRLARVSDLLGWWMNEPPPTFDNVYLASAFLRDQLLGHQVLMVIDDVWSAADIDPFRGLGRGSALLVTTRNRKTLPAECRRVDVDAMRRDEAVDLLTSGLRDDDTGLFEPLARRLGDWPLLLKLVNRQLRELVRDGGLDVVAAVANVEKALGEEGLTALDREDETARELAVRRTLEASLGRLREDERERFAELAVFPEDVDIPLAVLERFWSRKPFKTKQLCERFKDLSLLLRFRRQEGTIRLHGVVRQYLVDERRGALPALHRSFLERCRPPSGRWTDLAGDEAYLWRHLAAHLVQAGEEATLHELLFDFAYLRAKLAATGVNALTADYDAFPDDAAARDVQGALQLSAHVLVQDVGHLAEQQLAGQLFGRLMDREGDAYRRLREEAAKRSLLHPRGASLTRTGGPLLRTLGGHTDEVQAVAVLDDKRVVSAAKDQTLRVWDVASGETLRTLEGHADKVRVEGHADKVRAVAALDEDRVVSASSDHTVRVWDVASGETLRTLQGHTSGVEAVAVLDKNHVVSASLDHTLRIWDVASERTVQTLRHTSGVLAVVALDESRVVSASSDQTLRVWDVATGEILRTLYGHTSRIEAVAALDEDRVVSASSDQTLRVWDVATGETLRTLRGHTSSVEAVAVLDENRVVSASLDKTLRVWDVASGKTLRTLRGHNSWVLAVAALDENRVVSASKDQTLRVWDVASEETLRGSRGHTSEVRAVTVLDENRVVSASSDQTLRVWDVASGKTLCTLSGHNSGVLAVAVLDENRVVSASSGHTVRVWDVVSGETSRRLLGHTSRVEAVAVLDENRVVSASRDETLRVWDVASGKTLRTLRGHISWVLAVTVLDENRVVSASSDHTLRVWDVASEDTLQTLRGHTSGVNAVAVLDENRVVSASSDHTLRVWDVASGKTLRTLRGHTSGVLAVAVLDENRVVSASSDQTLRVWNVASGRGDAVFTLDAGAWSVAFALERRIVIAGDETGGVHFLDLAGTSESPLPASGRVSSFQANGVVAHRPRRREISRIEGGTRTDERDDKRHVPGHSPIGEQEHGGEDPPDPPHTSEPGHGGGRPGSPPRWTEQDLAEALAAAEKERDETFLDDLKWDAEYEAHSQARKKDRRRDLPFDMDPGDLRRTGWGVIFARDVDPRVETALRPLLERRKRQAGRRYKRLVLRPGESARSFLWRRHGLAPGVVKLDVMPFYLLLVGDPDAISYRFQYQLNVNHAVGRICFDTVEEYKSYARSVVDAEEQGVALPRRGTFVSVENDATTEHMARQMVDPLVERLKASESGWEVERVSKAPRARLAGLLKSGATPGLLLASCHGMDYPFMDPDQESRQGALLCQDWPGDAPVERAHYFAGDDIDADAHVHGLVAFLFACFGAGTPRTDDFPYEPSESAAPVLENGLRLFAKRPFVARLPQRLLAHPNGGALAVVSHIDRGWTLSFSWTRSGRHSETVETLEEALRQLLAGRPVGAALRPLAKRTTAIGAQLVDLWQTLREGGRVPDTALGPLWTAHNDARNLVVVGDPAVCLLGGH